MVQQRKLIGGINRHFHHPWCHFGAKPVLQTNGLSERVSVFGHFMGYQILPNFTNFYQKCVAKGGRRGSKRQLTGGFSRPIYLNRVKSRGWCQAVTGDRRVEKGGASAPPQRYPQDRLLKIRASARVAGLKPRPSEGSSGASEGLRGQCVDSKIVVRQVGQPKKRQHTELKGLTDRVSGERRTDLFGLCRAAETWRARSVDNLLIRQRMLARWRRRTGEGLLNLKDLLTVSPPRLKGLFENEPVLRHFLGYQIVPNFTIFDQKRAANGLKHGTKRGFFATDLFKPRQVPRGMSSCECRTAA